MSEYRQVNEDVIKALKPPGLIYLGAAGLLALGVGALLVAWIYQIRIGMGVAGISHPVGWGTYIGSFVFWIGIAHSGTLISAILYLVRSKWRTAISRSAEAMTLVAIATAGMFPLIHLGRFWVFYFIIPYPSQRQIWPNFQSPLVLDMVAIFTYLTVSTIFFFVGMVPDVAAARDHLRRTGEHPWQMKLYRLASLGWHGSAEQWRHHGRSYLFFAALATPLVVSVHSVVSWDFAAGILPGWHSTLFAPYFVAGAIHSGLAMVLTLLIPMRRILHFEDIIKPKHFQDVALLMIVTTLIVGYSYAIEIFMSSYSGNLFEDQFEQWRMTGQIWWFYPLVVLCNVLLPFLFVFKRVRSSLTLLFIISIFVNIGMWSERLWIVITATWHDFLPHNWGSYFPTWVELTILGGSFSLFFLGFLVLTKFLPAAPMSDIKTDAEEEHQKKHYPKRPYVKSSELATGVVGVYGKSEDFLDAVDKVRDHATQGLDTYTPLRVDELNQVLGRGKSPVRYWTLLGVLTGIAGGFGLAIGTALVNSLIVGGKHPISIVPYCIPAFEGGVLLGALGNLVGLLIHARLPRSKTPPGYDWQFSQDKFGLFVASPPERFGTLRDTLKSTNAERIYEIES
jgi:molybdopterin-containing oxidoreductase family membrane subunit